MDEVTCSAPPRGRRLDGLLNKALVLLVLAGGAAVAVHTGLLVAEFWNPVPWEDAYCFWFKLQEHGFRWADLFESHQGHILAVPRLFYLADLYLFRASGKMLLAFNSLFALAIPLVIFSVSKSVFPRRLDRWLYLAVLLAAYVNAVHMINLMWGFMIPHWLETLSSVLFAAVFARLLSASALRARLLLGVLASLLAATAAFSSGAGVLCLALGLGLSVVYRARWPQIVWFGLLLTAMVALYMRLDTASSTGRLRLILAAPADAIEFFLVYLGSPYLRYHTWPAGEVFWFFDGRLALGMGAAVLGAGAWVVLREWLARDRSLFSVFHVFLILFAFGTGALATLARLDQGIYYATVQKYACASMLAWIAIASLAIKQFGAAWGPLPAGLRPAAWMAGLLGVLALALPAHFREERVFRQWSLYLWDCESAMIAGVYDPPRIPIGQIFQEQSFHTAQHYIKRFRLGPFARYRFNLGDRLGDHFAVVDRPCEGCFDQRSEIPSNLGPGLRVTGWLWDPARARAPFDLVFADESGRIIGVGHCTTRRADVAETLRDARRLLCGWVGYTRPVPADKPILAYALIDEGRVCLVGKR